MTSRPKKGWTKDIASSSTRARMAGKIVPHLHMHLLGGRDLDRSLYRAISF